MFAHVSEKIGSNVLKKLDRDKSLGMENVSIER